MWVSHNGGDSWTKISPDLTRHDPKTMGDSGGPITRDDTGVETYATVFSIAPSPKDANLIWTGSDDGYVFVTRDGGKTWVNVTPKDTPEFARVSLVEASPHRSGTAYVAANHYQFDDFAPYVWRTDDYGQTWTKIVDGIAPNHYARAIREDTVRAKMLYLGTEHGVCVQTTDLHLFKPNDALRGLDRSLAVDYAVKQPAQKITIDSLDAQGNVIRSFSGTAADAAKPPAPPSPEDFFRPRDPKPPVGAGMHRLNWDLRYKGATDFPGLIMWAASTRGPVAPPGSYQVRVTADGQTETQPFAIKREPHLLADVTDADLQKEFDLAVQVSRKTTQANEAVLLVRGIKPQIDDRKNRLDSKTGPTAKALDKLHDDLITVETTLYQVKNQSSEDPLNFPIKLNNKIAAVQGVVESADSAPTEQSYDVFQLLAGRVDQELNKLDAAVKVDLPRVNQMLQKQRLAPIKAEPLDPNAADPKRSGGSSK